MNKIIQFRHFVRYAPQVSNQVCFYSNRKGIFGKIKENFQKEIESDKNIKENLDKFRKTKDDIQEFKQIRELYKKMEKEIPPDTVDKINNYYKAFTERINQEKNDIKKKELLKSMADNLEKFSSLLPSDLKDSQAMKHLSRMSSVINEQLISKKYQIYRTPIVLQTRKQCAGVVHMEAKKRIIEANDDATGVELHKDSNWEDKWNDFRDNNKYMQRFFDLKTQYDESDALAVRSVRWFTDKISSKMSLISNSEVSKTIAEIQKIDSTFSIHDFLDYTQYKIIPNVYEAMLSGNGEILKDWCQEAPYNMIMSSVKPALELGYHLDSILIDVHDVDLLEGQVVDGSPLLIIAFETQVIDVWRDSKGNVVKGDSDAVMKTTNHWVLTRDQSDFDPWAAWRLADFRMNSQKMYF